jgi:hypothetical protein
MPKQRPNWAGEDAISVMLWLDLPIHTAAKRCAALERRTLQAFCSEAVTEKVRQMLEEDIAAETFVPPGVRKR